MPKRGLPNTLRMRHDAHYVETLNAPSGNPVGRMVPIESIDRMTLNARLHGIGGMDGSTTKASGAA